MFRCLPCAHRVQELTGLRHERADATLQRLRHASPIDLDAGRGDQTLPCYLSMQLSVLGLLDAALGVCDAWNHGLLLFAPTPTTIFVARVEQGHILRVGDSPRIVEIAEWITEFG